MVELPILFNTEMVRAVLARKKRHTRRLLVPQVDAARFVHAGGTIAEWVPIKDGVSGPRGIKSPYGQKGDRLWCRETWGCPAADHPRCKDGRKPTEGDKIVYLANLADEYQWGSGGGRVDGFCWRPSIHMPRWACRLLLNVTGVRIERLQAITEHDARDEGVAPTEIYDGADRVLGNWFKKHGCYPHALGFAILWDSINTKIGTRWADNPYVWVVEFEVAT